MASGQVGDGLSYWANIKISGKLDNKDLKAVKGKIEAILKGKINGKPVKGKIASEARASDNNPTVTLNVTY